MCVLYRVMSYRGGKQLHDADVFGCNEPSTGGHSTIIIANQQRMCIPHALMPWGPGALGLGPWEGRKKRKEVLSSCTPTLDLCLCDSFEENVLEYCSFEGVHGEWAG